MTTTTTLAPALTTSERAQNPAAAEISGISSAADICELSPIVAALTEDFSRSRWERALVELARSGRRNDWTLGDLLNATKDHYGDGLYDRAAELTSYGKRHLENLAWVARRIAPADRVADLSLSVHEAVAKLPSDQQRVWLGRAREHGIPAESLRQQIRAGEQAPPPDEPTA